VYHITIFTNFVPLGMIIIKFDVCCFEILEFPFPLPQLLELLDDDDDDDNVYCFCMAKLLI